MNGIPEVRRILLVEDNEYDIEMTLAALGEQNLTNQIDVVRDGEQALDYLLGRGQFAADPPGAPAVVLLDLKLPRINGIQVLGELRGHARFSRLPVVMLTSSREAPDLRECYGLGCNAYVVKPVDFDQFCRALKVVGCFWAILNEPPLLPVS